MTGRVVKVSTVGEYIVLIKPRGCGVRAFWPSNIRGGRARHGAFVSITGVNGDALDERIEHISERKARVL